MLLASIHAAAAFSLNGYSWPHGTQIEMHLQLTRPPVAFQDGSASWNASATDALAIWNSNLDSVQFVAESPGSAVRGNGTNEVFFSDTIYGETWPTGALAVTLYQSSGGGVFTETDVIFNNKLKWNSYRGPVQGGGPNATFDFHRVALHEFGHVLGLDHPDQLGQDVIAIMNSIIGDLDHAQDDDVAGARSLYGSKITSSLNPPGARSGDNFSYQITANNDPTSFSATGLPPGLQIDAGSGLITGRCPTSGAFQVDVSAQGARGAATGRVRILITPLPITSSTFRDVEVGSDFSYQITAGNSPTSFEATPLPAGLQLNTATGVISGTAQVAGNFTIRLVARSNVSEAAGNLTLNVRAPRITSPLVNSSTSVGGTFTYQITASNNPTSFTATGLPAGLRLDPSTGQITGVAELSGQYEVTITAHGSTGTATATLMVFIQARDVSDPPFKKIAVTAHGSILADPARPRLYVPTYNGLVVIDTDSMAVLQTIPIPAPIIELSLSGDGNRLWLAGYYTPEIWAVDLNSFALSSIVTNLYPRSIREGTHGRLYVTDYNQSDIFQLDASTGGVLSQTNPRPPNVLGSCGIEISPDRNTLYVAILSFSGAISSYDISHGGTPLLRQRVDNIRVLYSPRALTVSPDGTNLSVQPTMDSFNPTPTTIRSTQDLNIIKGTLPFPSGPSQIVYSVDGSLAFQSTEQRSRIEVFRTQNWQLTRTITLPDGAVPADIPFGTVNMAVDRSNSYLFVASRPGPDAAVYVYSLITPPPPPAPPKTLLNVSTRLRAQAGDNALIGGFIIRGEQSKQIALRAIGPSMPVAGKLADPVLQLFDGNGALLGQNDNWNAHRAEAIATGIPPSNEREALMATSVPPGGYTALVRGVNNTTGVALVEVYDLSANSNSKLANISTRGKVETGDNVMIGGFILGGDQFTNIVVRAIGPSLANYGVGEPLLDPMLEVYDGNGALLSQDDDWRMYQEQQLIDSGLAPTDDRESAMLLYLQPGAYTAIVRGKHNESGVGLVEVYNLDAN
jgi:sugar lactone lactonase YvrE